MKIELRTLLASIAAGTLASCASGGGSGSAGAGPATDPAQQSARAGSQSSSPCGTVNGRPVQCVPTQRAAIDAAMSAASEQSMPYAEVFEALYGYAPPNAPRRPKPEPAVFTRWAELPAYGQWGEQSYEGVAVRMKVDYPGTWAGSSSRADETLAHAVDWGIARLYDSDRNLTHLPSTDGITYLQNRNASIEYSPATASFGTLEAIGERGIDVAKQGQRPGAEQNRFVDLPRTGDIAVAANPHAQGWSYQTFGVWDNSTMKQVVPISFGAPAYAIPTAGSYTFNGKLAGLYVSPEGQGSIATADVRVTADFSARSLTFASSRTTTTRDLRTAAGAPHLDLSGTLTYATQARTFTGRLTNAGGTMSGNTTGRYYGPDTNELGGVFNLKSTTSVETFTGAYGAKR